MNNIINNRSIIFVPVFFVLTYNISVGQVSFDASLDKNSDSLSLNNIIKQVVTSHPSVKAAEEVISNANARIGLARTGFYPEADLTGNYTNLGPVTKLTIPDLGTFQLFPVNNYSASVNIRQPVYDFGRTRQNIELEKGNKAIGEQTLEEVKQKLSLMAVNNFYALVYLQAAINIEDEQVATLTEHLRYVEKMAATGSGTEYQVLSTQVKLSAAISKKVDLIAALTTQQASMSILLDSLISKPLVRNELMVKPLVIPSDSIMSFALHNRDEVKIDKQRTSLAGLRYGMVKLQNKPYLNFMASGGAKNGFIPDLNKLTPNYALGFGLRIPLFDGMKTRYNLLQAQSEITSLSYESQLTKRKISDEVYEAQAYMLAAEKKTGQFELQLQQALKAYSLAETSFRSGVITNLDLLDANTAVSESELMLLKARIDYALSIYRLKAAMGERLY